MSNKVRQEFGDGALPDGDGELCASYSEPNPYATASKLYTIVHLCLGAY